MSFFTKISSIGVQMPLEAEPHSTLSVPVPPRTPDTPALVESTREVLEADPTSRPRRGSTSWLAAETSEEPRSV